MSPFQKLGLLGLLINSLGKIELSKTENSCFLDYLENEGIGPITRYNLVLQLNGNINIIASHFEYYDSSEMTVNKVLDDYLIALSNQIINNDYPAIRDVSMAITGQGNKPGSANNKDGVDGLIQIANGILDKYEDLDGDELPDQADEVYRNDARRLGYIDRVLSLVDVFVSARFGMLAGIEEYAPMNYNAVHPLESFDIVTGTECGGDADCKCGCIIDAAMTQLKGMEDYLSGNTNTSEYLYYEGVARANGQLMVNISGSEGAVFDAVKNLGREAYKAVMETWKSVQELFEEDDEDADKGITNVADDNKKAIQSMQDKGVAINDKAKAGITSMAEKVDPSGAMSKVVTGLNSPSSAPGVIDGLLALLGTNSLLTKGLKDNRKAAEDALAELKKASEAVSGDDTNKEAASAAKAAVQEKITKAREAVTAAKKAAQDHNKVLKGIRKAIRGISPHIFVTKDAGSDKGDDK